MLHHVINIMPPPTEAADVYGAGDLPATNSKCKEKLSKDTILQCIKASKRCLRTSKRKCLSAEDQITVTNKKMQATNQCKSLATLVRDKWRESNLALHEAVRDVAAAKLETDRVVDKSTEALSKVIIAECKKHVKQLSLKQQDFDDLVKDIELTSECQAKSAKQDFDDVVKDIKLTSECQAKSAKQDFDDVLKDIKLTSEHQAKSARKDFDDVLTVIKLTSECQAKSARKVWMFQSVLPRVQML